MSENPEFYTPEKLIKLREEMGKATFEREYMNNPIEERCERCHSPMSSSPPPNSPDYDRPPLPPDYPARILYCWNCGLVIREGKL